MQKRSVFIQILTFVIVPVLALGIGLGIGVITRTPATDTLEYQSLSDRYDTAVEQRNATSDDLDVANGNLDAAEVERDSALEQRDAAIAERDAAIAERDAAVQSLAQATAPVVPSDTALTATQQTMMNSWMTLPEEDRNQACAYYIVDPEGAASSFAEGWNSIPGSVVTPADALAMFGEVCV